MVDATKYANQIAEQQNLRDLESVKKSGKTTVYTPTPAEKAIVKFLLEHLKSNYGYWQQEHQNG